MFCFIKIVLFFSMYGDLLLALSGHPGSIFVRDSGGEFHISEDTPCLAPHEASLLNRILKIAKYYYNISSFTNIYKNIIKIRRTKDPPNAGLYTAALCFGLDRGLKSYRDTLIILDGIVRDNPNIPLSLLQFHLDKFQNLFPILAYIIDEIKTNEHMKGCKILELLHEQSACGIPFVKELLTELLQSCHSVFYQQLSAWVLHGQVKDHFTEFFIREVPEIDNDGKPYENEGGLFANFELNYEMVPLYISSRVIQTIHFIGSSVHIFGTKKYSSNPLQEEDEKHFVLLLEGLQRKDKFCPIEFERVIEIMREKVAQQLYNLVMNEGKLLETLELFKDFFLLGRGELFLAFIDSADNMMQHVSSKKSSDNDINRLFLKSYTQLGFPNEDHVEKFRFKFINDLNKANSAKQVPSKWNDLSLTYDVQWPLHILFTSEVMDEYNKIFMCLLKLSRCQIALQTAWSISTRSGEKFEDKLLNLRSNVAYLIDQLQYYLHVDVLETNYTALLKDIKGTTDFEAIRKAHHNFLGEIQAWSFLSGESEHDVTAAPVAQLIDLIIILGFKIAFKFTHGPDIENQGSNVLKLESNYEHVATLMVALLETSASRQHNSLMNQLLLRVDYNGFFSKKRNEMKEKMRQVALSSKSNNANSS